MTDAITIFAGGSDGYGDAVNTGRSTYHWAFNWQAHDFGAAAPAINPQRITPAPTSPYRIATPPTCIFEWEDTLNNPLILFGGGWQDSYGLTYIVQDGVLSIDQEAALGGAGEQRVTGGVLYRHDGTDATAEAAYFATGTKIHRRTKAGAYSSTTLSCDGLWVIGSDLYRTYGAGISKLADAATDPMTAGNWATLVQCGRPTYPINVVVELGGSPIVLKGDGVFKYNPDTGDFSNLTGYIIPHVDNGKGGWTDGRGRWYFPTTSGEVIVGSFGAQANHRPSRINAIGRDTPWGRITAITADAEHVYAAVAPGQTRTQQLGLTVMHTESGVFTNDTTTVTDQSIATTVSLSGITATDAIYIGSSTPEPFWGIYAQMLAGRSTSTAIGLTFALSDGANGWTAISGHDSTYAFYQSGSIVIDSGTDPYAAGTWLAQTVNGVSAYWLRIKFDFDVPGACTISEVSLIPYRPPLDPDLFPDDCGRKLAGALPTILVGSWAGERLIWYDAWTIDGPQVDQMVISRTAGTNTTGGYTLWLVSRDAVRYIPIGVEANPVRAAWPLTNGGTHILAFSGNDFGLPVNVKEVHKLVLYGEYLQSDDDFYVYHWWDNGSTYHKNGPYHGFPIVVDTIEGRGRVLNVAVQLSDTTRDATAPYVMYCGVPENGWTDLGPIYEALSEDIQSPPRR